MIEDVIRAQQCVGNEIIEAYKNQGILDSISDELLVMLGKQIMRKINDGQSYIATVGEEKKVPKWAPNMTVFSKNVYFSEIIRCVNCKYTPEIDVNFIKEELITRLPCRRLGEIVHPQGYCCWAEKRNDEEVVVNGEM